MTELHDLTALEQGELVRRCEVSSAELAEHYLSRISRLDDVGAFVTVGDSCGAHRLGIQAVGESPLWGVPTAIKDLNLTAGMRTTFGSAAYADYVPDVSDNVTLSLEAAGMVSLGKTATPEFGAPCYTEPAGRPPAVTPWDRSRMAGGSSGGAAAAVAAGLVPVAQGSDGGGSIRIPASCCGLVGFKPSRGVVSPAPVYGDPVGLSGSGPLARNVRDAAALLDVLAGRRVGDPFWSSASGFLAACSRPVAKLRIARFVTPVIASAAAVDPECVTAWSSASSLLESLGHSVEDVPVPLPPEAVPVFETCWAVLTALSTVPAGHSESELRPLTRWLTERGRAVSGPDFGLAIGAMRRFAADALAALASYDAVLTPTLAAPPLPVGALRDDEDPARDFENQKAFTPWTSAWNVTGMPAVSLPLHWTASGLPVGVMLAGRPGEDALLFSLAAQVEEAVGGFTRTPPGW